MERHGDRPDGVAQAAIEVMALLPGVAEDKCMRVLEMHGKLSFTLDPRGPQARVVLVDAGTDTYSGGQCRR